MRGGFEGRMLGGEVVKVSCLQEVGEFLVVHFFSLLVLVLVSEPPCYASTR